MGSQLNGVLIYLGVIAYGLIWCFIGSMLSPALRTLFRMRQDNATTLMLVLCCAGFVLGLIVAFASQLRV